LLRASDSDRQKIADVIADAYADGRLTADEHSQRLDSVWAAKTLGELEPLVVDLGRPISRPQSSSLQWPGSAASAGTTANTVRSSGNLPATVGDNERAFAILATSRREGEWLVPPHMTMLGVMGSVEWDMRNAIFTSPTIIVDVALTMGSMTLRIPDGVGIEDKTIHILSDVQFKGVVAAQPGAPVIVLQGFLAMGSITIKGSGDKPFIERLGFKAS
jgi:hypothetical protein